MTEIVVRQVRRSDEAEWLRMRSVLWGDSPPAEHAGEIEAFLSGEGPGAVFVAERPASGLCGFVEAAVRPAAEGCHAGPVGYLEGWYVDPDVRRQGTGRALVRAAESWAVAAGCRQMASDAELDNTTSLAAHQALGYQVVVRAVHFMKPLRPAEVRHAGRGHL
jgi:aminoglycoside 6'-N-acetyltransferase I